jgi:hypothetical protein
MPAIAFEKARMAAFTPPLAKKAAAAFFIFVFIEPA